MLHIHREPYVLSTLSKRTISSLGIVSLNGINNLLSNLFTYQKSFILHNGSKKSAVYHFSTDIKASERQVSFVNFLLGYSYNNL